MRTIIVATDYSATANNALEFGANMARIFKAELILFNVYHLDVHVRNALVTPDAIDNMIENNEIHVKQLAAETAERYGLSVSTVIEMIDTVEALENYAATSRADLIVMGMDSNLTEYKLFGNTTTAAVRRLKCPLLVVPNNVAFKGIKKVLYACEHTFLTEDNHLDMLKEITRKFDADLQIFHVETKEKSLTPSNVSDQIAAIDNLMENVSHTYSFAENPSIIEGITKHVKDWQPDLLVMVPHRTSFWELLLKGSTTREMTLKTRVPLLVLPNHCPTH